ncbi:MAG: hypothetical protein ACJ8AT_32985 [Hyalangium sp.]|uniref:hypothetical protein n=1 Tax=Hyalangium sp. TaxID=2028555 RepID=UPI00389A1CA7
MPLVYSSLRNEVEETDVSEEEHRQAGLEPIKTKLGIVWAAPENREGVLLKCGRPMALPPPLLSNGPPPPFGQQGPPPPFGLPSQGGNKVVVHAPPREKLTEDNKSSAVPKQQMDAFVEGLVEQGELGFPVYSVSDNNSFHTSGYLWGYYAARTVKELRLPPGPIAVVNFDSHQDAGVATSRVVASDRWGSILIKQINDLGFPACYLSAFNKMRRSEVPGKTFSYFGVYPKNPALKPPGSIIPQSDKNAEKMMEDIRKEFRDFWKSVNEHFGEPIKYVFFTIDRDVLNDSYTQWGNGTIRGPTQLIQLMEAVLEPLNILRGADKPQAQLIGFDITGLPESMRYHIDPPSGGAYADPKVVWSKLSQELYAVLDFAHSRLLDARRSIYVPHVLFFSGSISYASLSGKEPDEWNCWDYVSFLSQRLKLLLGSTNVYYHEGWSYLLCQQAAPIYEAAWKRFTLYKPAKLLEPGTASEVEQQLGEGTPLGGFACTASVSDYSRFEKSKQQVPFDDMVSMVKLFAPPQ